MPNTILRLPAVKLMTGKSRTAIYVDMKRDRFPKPISIGDRAVGWVLRDVEDWLNSRVMESLERRNR